MEISLKDLIEFIEKNTKFTVKFVLCWYPSGTVDSEIYDAYEEAVKLLERNGTTDRRVIPVIVKKD
jgi:hypothetical protein